ncbi:MAG TPA: LysM peptidoglycan-binding domain-containing protein [Dyella sp.]|uniref:LysM peptidoglycan-binding domain-containing protein n=1 Tax=Dyella sp. TaxID=1869338 RepID=UPI002D03234B|nr:LysM peptidoglycan-binding domain-containing protein [Dyella sp.]HUB92162.1 LysM peptidoglycan-binding domain-containing protein [Dyella sp.]
MSYTRRLLPVALTSLLAACATPPANKPAPSIPATVSPAPNPPPAAPSPAPPASSSPATPEETGTDVWDKLRGSFAMADCDADPQILVWAHRYTQSPQRFEQQMTDALPQVIYVQQAAEKYGVAGEFVLLPWVESQYRPVPGHRNLPAGMWQLVQSTARVMGLPVDHSYDGRLDTSAATDGVMHMLRDYYDQLHDWRLVDYAFNRGENGVRRMVQQHGLPPDEPAIPKWPVPKVTREHLTKLLAISCVVRDPSRFHVELPTLPADQHLETVQIHHDMTLSAAADHAGMEADDLKRLNPALQTNFLSADAPGHLLMPHHNAELLRNAMQIANAQGMMASASPNTPLPAMYADTPAQSIQDEAPRHSRTHVVKSGESLWQIAHNYSISVNTLERLNHLHGKTLKPGQVLKLDPPNHQ